ncbi:MAG: glutaminase [Brumimicrobium sp.]
MKYDRALKIVETEIRELDLGGYITDYIPELARISPDKFGLNLYTKDKENFCFGDSQEPFSIQSISKVFTTTLAHIHAGTEMFRRVGVEPSGNAYNSLTELERDYGIPRNPFINAGAIVTADILISHLKNPKDELLKFVRKITGDNSIDYDLDVMKSEASTGFRNIALVNYMKALGNIENDAEKVLDLYFHQCALSMSCLQLSRAFMIYANQGVSLETGERIIEPAKAKRMNALMQTCGFYDEAGEFAYRVGLPGKSGVGGGIVAVRPGQYSIAVWSPLLNKKGNSMRGMRALEMFTKLTDSSIF